MSLLYLAVEHQYYNNFFSYSAIPDLWIQRAVKYSLSSNNTKCYEEIINTPLPAKETKPNPYETIIQLDKEKIYPSQLGNYIYSIESNNLNTAATNTTQIDQKLVCYYAFPDALNLTNELYINDIDADLCTHINVGMIWIQDNRLDINDSQQVMLKQTSVLKRRNPKLKILLWVGGADSTGFSEMVKNHANRKLFIQSLKETLDSYALDGLDIDCFTVLLFKLFTTTFHCETVKLFKQFKQLNS